VTLTTPLLRVILMLGLDMAYMRAKFDYKLQQFRRYGWWPPKFNNNNNNNNTICIAPIKSEDTDTEALGGAGLSPAKQMCL